MTFTAKVLGVKRVDFTNDEGEHIQGRQVWLGFESDESSWNGYEVMKVWVADSSDQAGDAAALLYDDVVIAGFNRKGKPFIEDFAPVLV